MAASLSRDASTLLRAHRGLWRLAAPRAGYSAPLAGSALWPQASSQAGSSAPGWLVHVDWSLWGRGRFCFRRRRKREAAEHLWVAVVAQAARSAQVHAAVLAQAVLVLLVMVYFPVSPVVEPVRGHDRYQFSGQ